VIKNTASQKVGVQMVAAADGSAFTSAVTVSVTGDAGTQATGSVGSGACTHEGNGYHTYAPAQAETNYDLIAFTFTGTGAVPQTVQVYTVIALQTGDSFARLGAPAGASVSADIAAIEAQTDDIGAAGAGLTAADDAILAILGTPAGASLAADVAAVKVDTAAILVDTGTTLDGRIPAALTADGLMKADTLRIGGTLQTANDVGGDVNEILLDTAEIGAAGAGLTVLATQASVNTIDDFLDTEIAAILAAVDTEVAAILAAVDTEVAAIKAKTDQLTFTKANELDANMQSINGTTVNGDGSATPWGP
jgi:hypothetical protein